MAKTTWPQVRMLGVDGILVTFSDRLSDGANRAALAFRSAVDSRNWPSVLETTPSLVSTLILFDTVSGDRAALLLRINELLASRDWTDSLPTDTPRLWRIPTAFGGSLAPDLAEAAALADLTPAQAIASIADQPVRVQAIGFAPGQPYLGELPPAWDIPRKTSLTPQVPEGALNVAIRQLVLYSIAAPTGWRHIGQTAFRAFRPDRDMPFLLRPGDRVQFQPVTPARLGELKATTADGGATLDAP